MTSDDLAVRRATADDFPGILDLGRRTLGWADDDPAFLTWKHQENPFGASPMWLALADGRVVGLRAFLRWEFRFPGGEVVKAARAVDTATDPDFQGRGLFTRMTLEGLEHLAADGVRFVFNTPNPQSRPGYLKMGWTELGRLPTAVMPTGAHFFAVAHTARTAADLDSLPTEFGDAASEAFTDRAAVDTVLATSAVGTRIVTHRTPELLAWRYGFAPLGYRVVARGTHLDDGFAVFRRRRRGRAVECVLCDLVVPDDDPRLAGELIAKIRRGVSADYLIRLDHRLVTRGPFVRIPRLGPTLTCRALDAIPVPGLERWALTMGDVELF